MITFPDNFLWGAATSAHQVEGNNSNNDWWEWEKKAGLKEASGQACRHYEFFKQDFDLAKGLSHNAHRLSIEWSRVEPRQGQFSSEEINHYKEVIRALKERGLEPIVTLHHFTNPLWFSSGGGWLRKDAHTCFSRYTEKIVEALSDDVRYWITINEPMVYIYHGYITGIWPPQEKSFLKALAVGNNMAFSHVQAYRRIHALYKNKNLKTPYVSIAKNVQAFVPASPTLKNKMAVYVRDALYNMLFVKRLIRHKALDFIGINYYTRGLVDVKKCGLGNFLLDTAEDFPQPLKKNDMGWEIYPEGIYQLLMKFKRFNLPILIAENGICTGDDSERWDYIREHLKNIHAAIRDGAKVIGYMYWSLMDNFEWDKGFWPRFGLVEIDYTTYKRVIRKSAEKFAGVCRTQTLDENGTGQ
jgi:beta-glucosidase